MNRRVKGFQSAILPQNLRGIFDTDRQSSICTWLRAEWRDTFLGSRLITADAHTKDSQNIPARIVCRTTPYAPVRDAGDAAGRGNKGLFREQELYRHRIMLGLPPDAGHALGSYDPCQDLPAESGQRDRVSGMRGMPWPRFRAYYRSGEGRRHRKVYQPIRSCRRNSEPAMPAMPSGG